MPPLAYPATSSLRASICGSAQPETHTPCEVRAARLHEETVYSVMVRSKTGSSVRLSHRHEAFLGGLTASEDGLLFYGTINFHSNIGYSSFQVSVGGVPEFGFRVEVFPSKLEYKDDYSAILGDVHRQMMGLALESTCDRRTEWHR